MVLYTTASDEDSLVNSMNDLYAQNESHVYGNIYAYAAK
jgi:hypothetical protein